MVDVVEYTDPVCSWAWGSEPKLRLLRWRHGHRMTWRTVMGGLLGDAAAGRDVWDPIKAGQATARYWSKVTPFTGAPWPMHMEYMLRSSDAPDLAVKAAALQGDEVAARVLRRFRESIFVFGRPPGDRDQILESVVDVPGLQLDAFEVALDSVEAADAYEADWKETREPNDYVRELEGDWPGIGNVKHSDGHDRYAFPTVLFRGPGGEHTAAGWVDFEHYEACMEAAVPGSTGDPRPDPTPAQAFERWPLLTAVELNTLCGQGAVLPDDVRSHDWGEGLVYLTEREAAARGLS